MATSKEKDGTEKQATGKPADDNFNVDQEKALKKGDTDTAPDEFIGPDADTDQPIDGSVVNDAVLRGEPHADDKLNQRPLQQEEGK